MHKMILLLVSSVLVALAVTACDDDEDPTTAIPPVLSATPVDMVFDPADSSCGDIKFESPVLIPFGAPILPENRPLPAIEYFTIPGAPVRAVTTGIVDTIVESATVPGEYTIVITSLPGTEYQVIYQHVITIDVLAGTRVAPGDTLGEAGVWSDGMRYTALQVTLGEAGNLRSYCPLSFGDSAFVERHDRLLQEYARRGFTPAYDSFCLLDVVSP